MATEASEVFCIKKVRKFQEIAMEDEAGDKKLYKIKELVGIARDEYISKYNARYEASPDGKTRRMKNFKDFQAQLISMCLFDDKNTAVPLEEIQQYPASAQNELYKICEKVNAMDEEEPKEGEEFKPKND